ncbi:hypothetical protein KJ855_00110, partial [Patescibacteria group bacterium]|nr:hypothetical protein [Patescibacteria group bacterium]
MDTKTNEYNQEIDISKLSKPLEIKQSKNWFDRLKEKIVGSTKKIQIFSHEQAETSSGMIETEEMSSKDKKADTKEIDRHKEESKKVDAAKGDKFFAEANLEDEAGQEEWLAPTEVPIKEKTPKESPTSFSWLIVGSLSMLLVVILVFASFGLVNLVKNYYQNQSLSNVEQSLKQAEEFYQKGEYEPAKFKVDEVLSEDDSNQTAIELKSKINQKRGENILNEFSIYKELDLTLTAENTYNDPNLHFSVIDTPEWSVIDSEYDLKYSSGDASYGIKKYPRVNTTTKLENQYMLAFANQAVELLTKKEDTNFQGMKSSILVLEDVDYYIVTVLAQKYYFGYEITGMIPKKDSSTKLTEFKQLAATFNLLPEFTLQSYDGLYSFSSNNFDFHSFVQLPPEQQTFVIDSFTQSQEFINSTLLTNWTDTIEVYLYPDFATLYQYTLSDNSFADIDTQQMHIVFENPESHQSFGYETTKIIFENTFGEVKEKMILEGIAVMLDQTGRDYSELVRLNPPIPLEDLLNINWEIRQGDLKYFTVGVLANYLIDQYGIDLYVNLAREKEFPDAFEKIYDKTLD